MWTAYHNPSPFFWLRESLIGLTFPSCFHKTKTVKRYVFCFCLFCLLCELSCSLCFPVWFCFSNVKLDGFFICFGVLCWLFFLCSSVKVCAFFVVFFQCCCLFFGFASCVVKRGFWWGRIGLDLRLNFTEQFNIENEASWFVIPPWKNDDVNLLPCHLFHTLWDLSSGGRERILPTFEIEIDAKANTRLGKLFAQNKQDSCLK